jgi:hypothetical protein
MEEKVTACQVIEGLKLQLADVHALINSMNEAIKSALEKKFVEAGGCPACFGRGFVFADETYHDPCINEKCSVKSRAKSGECITLRTEYYDLHEYRLTVQPLVKVASEIECLIFELGRPPRVGDEVIVTKGRKVPIGFTGRITWVGDSQYNGSRHFKMSRRVGIKSPDSNEEVMWTSISNVEKLM